jgi:hypothetical protein
MSQGFDVKTVVWTIPIVVGVILSDARAGTLFVTMSGSTTEAVTFRLSFTLVNPPDAGGNSFFPPLSGSLPAGASALEARDALLPIHGAKNQSSGDPMAAKRVRVGGQAAVKMQHDSDFLGSGITSLSQCWVAGNDGEYALLEPSVPVTKSGITFMCVLPELLGGSASGNVPAVGSLGLGFFVLLLLGVGAIMIVRRRQASTT